MKISFYSTSTPLNKKLSILGVAIAMATMTACGGNAKIDSAVGEPVTYTDEQRAANGADEAKTFEANTFSYGIGFGSGKELANRLAGDTDDIDVAAFVEGFRQGLAGGEPKYTEEHLRSVFGLYETRLKEKAEAEKAAAKKEAADFLAKNAKKDGVITLDSGLQYKVLTEGKGAIPKATDKVSVHYEGKLLNGEIFDSSYERNKPTSFPVTGVIKGWVEALQLMPVGSTWEVYVPPELGYGENGRPGIPGNAAMIFKIELLDIVTAPKAEDKAADNAENPKK